MSDIDDLNVWHREGLQKPPLPGSVDLRYGWFGEPWPSGVCDDPDAQQLPTPVGRPCMFCDEPIQDGENGPIYANGFAQHKECAFRSVVGSLAHVQKRCSCFVPGAIETDPEGMTRREGALAVWAQVRLPVVEDICPPVSTAGSTKTMRQARWSTGRSLNQKR